MLHVAVRENMESVLADAREDTPMCPLRGRMRVISVIEEPPVIEKILRHLALPHIPLPTAPGRGQKAFAFEAA